MKGFLTDPERAKQLALAGRSTILEKFDIERGAESHIALYERLLGRHGGELADHRGSLA